MESNQIITQSFLKRPSARVPRGAIWHIGNTRELPDAALYFALGREAIVQAQSFNDGTKEFLEASQEQAPFTHGVYDTLTQTAGILVRPGVSMSSKEVARKLEVLLQSTGIAEKHNRSRDSLGLRGE